MRALIAIALVAACQTGEIRDPSEFSPASPLPHEPLFGAILHEGSPLRPTTVSLTSKGSRVYAYVYEGAGWDAELRSVGETATTYVVDPATGAGEVMPGPDVPPSRSHQFGVPIGDGALLLIGRDSGIDVAYFDGAAWTTMPGPANLALTGVTHAVARSASEIILTTNNAIAYVRTGSTWRRLPLPASEDMTVGPWDAGGLQLVYEVSGRVCAARYTTAALASGSTAPAPVCVEAGADRIAGSAVNGTLDDFQVLARVDDLQVRVVRFTGASASVGRAFPGSSMISAPGSSRPIVTRAHEGSLPVAYFPTLVDVEGGERKSTLLEGGVARSPCDCDRDEDPACPCFARDAAVVLGSTDAAGTRFALLIVDDVDGRRTVSVRVLPLPFDGAPFPAPRCDLVCAAPFVCTAHPVTGNENCVDPTMEVGDVDAVVAAEPADRVLAPSAAWTLSSPDPSCRTATGQGVTFDVSLDPLCAYVLDATAVGHAPLHVEGLTSPTENEPFSIGPYTLARGALLDPAPATEPLDDDTRYVVSPTGGRMILSVVGAWRWIESAATPLGIAVTTLADAPAGDGAFNGVRVRFVGATRALVPTATEGIHLVESGAIVATLAGTFALARAQVARSAPAAIVPSGMLDDNLHTTAATIVRFQGSTLVAAASATITGRGHAIRADASEAGWFDRLGRLVLLDGTTGTTATISATWPNTTGLRLAFGAGDDYLVVAPQAANSTVNTTPCTQLYPCTVLAFEDVPGDPGDPVTRQLVTISTRALWAETSITAPRVTWMALDAQNVAHLYTRDTTTLVTTEIPLGPTINRDLAHAAVGDKLVVMVPTGLVIVDLATGASRLEAGTFNSGVVTDPEPLVRVDDGWRIWLREACGDATLPCGLRVYDPATDTVTRFAPDAYRRFGVANDRELDGGTSVILYDGAGAMIRTYATGASGVDVAFRTSRARGAPCVPYWRTEPWPASTRRWYCSD